MKRNTITLFGILFLLNATAQNGYYNIPIRHDTAIQWAAESDKVLNLSPKKNEYSLKKWYTEKLKNGSVTAYTQKDGNSHVSPYHLSMPQLERQDWLKGLIAELSPLRRLQEWYFVDNTLSGYERVKYRGGVLNLTADTCCGCDETDAFRAKQVLNYKNGKFSIYTVFISPLCARKTSTAPFEWYPLCNVAYNDNPERKFPGLSKDVVLLNTNEIDYDFSEETGSHYDSVLTIDRTDIGNLIYQDILKGKIKAVETETGKIIPAKNFLGWRMSSDTIPVYAIDDPTRITKYSVVQHERDARDFNRIRIKQDIYFDFNNERLYSVIRSVSLVVVVKGVDGSIRGSYPFCRLE